MLLSMGAIGENACHVMSAHPRAVRISMERLRSGLAFAGEIRG
jgi:hypothetical protein